MLFVNELYNIEKTYHIRSLIFKCLLSFSVVSVGCYLLSISAFPYASCFALSMMACVLILCWRFIFYWITPKLNIQQKVLFVGTDELSKRMVRETLADDRPKFKVVGFIGNDPSLVGKSIVNPKVLGLVGDLDSIIKKERVEKLIVSCHEGNSALPIQDLVRCKFKGIDVLDLHTYYEYLKGKILLDGLQPDWLIFAHGFKKTRLIQWGKRIFDIFPLLVYC
jgi:FlaA1/EpsC-like NDP-sugar epimerase